MMKCPRCQAEVEGHFCGFCGGALKARRCLACTAPVPPGFRFCSECGAEQAGGPAPVGRSDERVPAAVPIPPSQEAKPNRRAWWIAGAALAGGILFLSVPYVWTGWADYGESERVPMSAIGATPAPGPAPNIDLSTMTRREAADRLFNRVMTALGEGDQAEVDTFLPMAIDAYDLVQDLDADGHFHLSLLQQTAGDHRAGLETAERVLQSEPDHLLALYAAGEAARELGDAERTRAYFQHLLNVYDTESVRDLPEYREHGSFLPTIREAAQDFLASGGL